MSRFLQLVAMLQTKECWKVNEFFRAPAPDWDQFHVDWVPIVTIGKKKYIEKDHENANKRALRAKETRQQAVKQAELEATEKTKRIHKSNVPKAKIDFSLPTSSVKQHSEGLETVSVVLELDNVYKLDENKKMPENQLLPDLSTDSVQARQHTASPVWKEATTSHSSCQTDEFECM